MKHQYKLSQNFTEGNTRKVSGCLLCLHVCDVIQFRDDHTRMRINGPLASLAHFFFLLYLQDDHLQY